MRDFMKSHYEKVILGSLLVIFVALLLWQVGVVKRVQEQQVEKMINRPEPETDQKVDDFKDKKYTDEALFGRIELWTDKKHDFCSTEPLAFCPFCFKLIPVSDIPAKNKTGVCSRCGKTLEEKQKPLAPVKPVESGVVAVNADANGNYLPDEWEKGNGLISETADGKFDASQIPNEDPDNDGFNNGQEYVYKTNPVDAKSHPKYADFTYVKDMCRVKIEYLKLTGVMIKTDPKKPETWKLNIQHYQKRRTVRQYQQGDEFINLNKAYVIQKVLVEKGELKGIVVCAAGEKPVTCMQNADVYEPDLKITLANAVFPTETYVTAVGKKVELGNDSTGKEIMTVKSCNKNNTVTVSVNGKDIVLNATPKRVRSLMDDFGEGADNGKTGASAPTSSGLNAL